MAQAGWWGDKTIIYLSGDGERRHKKWCKFLGSDGLCSSKCMKCTGSAQCEQYVKRFGAGPIDSPESIKIPAEVERVEIKTPKPKISVPVVENQILGRRPNFDEKLLGKIVFAKTNCNRIIIGEVIAENLDYITIDKDEGGITKYDRRISFSRKSIWVLDEYSHLF